MELKELITLYRRWIWLLIAGMILGLASGVLASKMQVPVYEVSAKVLVAKGRQQSNTDILAISDQQLVVTYTQLLKTRPVLNEVGSRLAIDIDPDNIQVDVVPDSQIIQVKVQDASPGQAFAIANSLVQILIEQNETLYTGRYSAYEESLTSQIALVQEQINSLQDQIAQINQSTVDEQLALINQQIEDLRTEISSLEKDIAEFPAVLSTVDRASLAEKQTQLDQLQSLLMLYQEIKTNLTFIGKPVEGSSGPNNVQITGLQSTLNLYQGLYLNLMNNLTSAKLARVQSTPTISQIDNAAIPQKPIRPIPLLYTALAGVVGLFLAAGAVLLIDYLDDTLTSSQKIQELLGVPVLGEITTFHQLSTDQMGPLLLNSFGILRINLSRLLNRNSLKTILITSPALGDGKTKIATNLATAFAQAGKKVILLDADLYQPALHSQFEIEDKRGLSDILSQNLNWQEVAHDFGEIAVITSGSPSLSSTGLLESNALNDLLNQLEKRADVVIIDGPPLFVVDAHILASKVGSILMVLRQGGTDSSLAKALLRQLNMMDVNVLGVVLNRVPRSNAHDNAGYYRHMPEGKIEAAVEKLQVSRSEKFI